MQDKFSELINPTLLYDFDFTISIARYLFFCAIASLVVRLILNIFKACAVKDGEPFDEKHNQQKLDMTNDGYFKIFLHLSGGFTAIPLQEITGFQLL